jgi:hypothetical protein
MELEKIDGLKNNQIPNFMKIRLLGVEMLHADGRMDW